MSEQANQTTRVGLFGWPVEHSLSPAMHNAAFLALKMNWRYELLPIPPGRLADEVARRMDEGFRGFNVTVPHKRAVLDLPQIGEVTPAAQAIGAANTLTVLPDGTLQADNTDWEGFRRDLQMYRVAPDRLNCLVLGTGGSARAVIYALEQMGARSIVSVSREPDGSAGVIGYDELAAHAPGANLVINCTPLGLAPDVERSPWPDDIPLPEHALLYDLVYNPPVTALMRRFMAAGLRAFGGLGMLVWQGALAWARWTDARPPVDIMFAAARNALRAMTAPPGAG